jgi:murein DD-endopeptidase MepM/ murein hydrolase activator NlpD
MLRFIALSVLFPLTALGGVITAELDDFGALYRGSSFLLKLSGDTDIKGYEISWQGKVFALPADDSFESANKPRVTWALLPADYGKSGEFELSVRAEGCVELKKTITVDEKEYEKESLTVDPKFVYFSKETLEQIRYEQEIMRGVLSLVSETRLWNPPFARPRNSPLRSPFGILRVFNGEPRNKHSGLDFAGAAGSEIKAVENGVVSAAGDFYFGGKTVVIDHGMGVSSIYMHLSEIGADVGDYVERGMEIGKVGATGRVTGPHLHLGISLFGVMVDPLPLLEKQ